MTPKTVRVVSLWQCRCAPYEYLSISRLASTFTRTKLNPAVIENHMNRSFRSDPLFLAIPLHTRTQRDVFNGGKILRTDVDPIRLCDFALVYNVSRNWQKNACAWVNLRVQFRVQSSSTQLPTRRRAVPPGMKSLACVIGAKHDASLPIRIGLTDCFRWRSKKIDCHGWSTDVMSFQTQRDWVDILARNLEAWNLEPVGRFFQWKVWRWRATGSALHIDHTLGQRYYLRPASSIHCKQGEPEISDRLENMSGLRMYEYPILRCERRSCVTLSEVQMSKNLAKLSKRPRMNFGKSPGPPVDTDYNYPTNTPIAHVLSVHYSYGSDTVHQ